MSQAPKGKAGQELVAILEDLGVDYSDWLDNPEAFSKRIASKAKELAIELEKKNSISDLDDLFKSKALKNEAAAAEAEAFVTKILDDLLGMDAEIIANVLVRLPEVTRSAHQIVRATSMRQSGRGFSKKRIHTMYVRLRKAYETYCDFMRMFNPDKIGKPPFIPPKSGNYGDDSPTLGIKEYIFVIDDTEWLNYYTAARILGIEIKHYMDLVEFFNTNPTHNGKKLKLMEISR